MLLTSFPLSALLARADTERRAGGVGRPDDAITTARGALGDDTVDRGGARGPALTESWSIALSL